MRQTQNGFAKQSKWKPGEHEAIGGLQPEDDSEEEGLEDEEEEDDENIDQDDEDEGSDHNF
jgi:hypothetical protein